MDTFRQEYKEQQRQIRIDSKPEIWKDIPWYEGLYMVSSFGNVKSFLIWRWNMIPRLLSPNNIRWYPSVQLSKWGIVIRYRVNRLVWFAFLWLEIEWSWHKNSLLVCHQDDNPQNNNIDNLFLGTAQQNTRDMWEKWRYKWWTPKRKVSQYSLCLDLIKEWDSVKNAKILLGINNISACCLWKQKTAWGFIWKY